MTDTTKIINVTLGIISRNSKQGKEYLLVSSILDYGKYTGFYYPPGGQIKKGEDEKEVLTRKIREELGLLIKPIKKVTESPGDVKNSVISWWLVNSPNKNVKKQPNKLSEIQWLTRDEIINGDKIWPATRKFFEEYISRE